MAYADYKLCDVCGHKAFYDANLNYGQGPSEYDSTAPYREVGDEQFNDPERRSKYGMRLDRLGDWAVICSDCAPRFKTAIVPICNPSQGTEP